MTDKPTLFMIGNTHFDPVWLWTWEEAMASIRATFRSHWHGWRRNRILRYSFATPPVFRWIEDTDPALFDEIRSRVADGHWELAEGFWNQPDCYTGSGESYVRHALYGQAYLTKVFGKRAVSVMQVDSFGHSPQLPQILRKAGMHCYLFTRPEAHHVPLPAPRSTGRHGRQCGHGIPYWRGGRRRMVERSGGGNGYSRADPGR